ncbi:hypothetical protein ANAPC3_00025 [Anaplasma phagocytophilum]|nr:hypothetical protein ANAPC3_00025 [Anaplasma phagocytophilum]SBO30463.1 hypothetical protein ANAPC2_00256 [Anaplasma phagocytophilum]
MCAITKARGGLLLRYSRMNSAGSLIGESISADCSSLVCVEVSLCVYSSFS